MYDFAFAVLFFGIYAFCGWLWEFLFNLVMYRRVRLHGFLTLPLLPIYGFSALAIVALVYPHIENPFLVFVTTAALVTSVEYLTSLALETLFRIRLWDYTEWPLDFYGRVSFFSSLGFGVLGLFLLYIAQPFFSAAIANVPWLIVVVTGWALCFLVLIDFGNQVSALVRLRRADGSLDDIMLRLEQSIDGFTTQGRRARAWFDRWYGFNLRHLRRAFPRAKRLK